MPPLDFSSLKDIQGQAGAASGQAASLAEGTPGLLQQLKSNLTSIFAKDNPLIAARGTALQDFLNASSQSRVATLPQNLPTVEGSQLNLSPTQQNAITTSRESAALAPLAGLNQIITGIYGNIPQMVQNAAGIYEAQVRAQQLRAQMLQQQYENAYSQILEQEKTRQFNVQEKRLKKGTGTGDLSSIIAAILAGNQEQPGGQERPPLESFDAQEPASQFPAPLPQQIPAIPQAGFEIGLPTQGIGQRFKDWGNTFWGGLTGNYGKF